MRIIWKNFNIKKLCNMISNSWGIIYIILFYFMDCSGKRIIFKGEIDCLFKIIVCYNCKNKQVLFFFTMKLVKRSLSPCVNEWEM